MSARPPEETTGVAEPAAPGAEVAYDAFVSYSHQERAVALGLQRGLHSVGRRFAHRRALRVFRDATDLTASPDLWGRVTVAMDASRFLVVLLSPAAAASTWVAREIEYWLDTRGPDNLLLVIGDGTLVWHEQQGCFDAQRSTAAPPLLTRPGVLPTQPFYVDVSTDAPWDPKDPVFREKVTDLAAPIHGMPKSDLAGDDLREQRRVRRLRNSAVAALVILTVAAVLAAWIAIGQTREAEAQRREAEVQRREAETQRDQAVALALAAESRVAVSEDPPLAIGLAAESLQAGPDPIRQARAAMVAARLEFADRVGLPIGEPLAVGSPGGFFAIEGWGPGGSLPMLDYDDETFAFGLVDKLTGQPLTAALLGHSDRVTSYDFSPDGTLIASGSADSTARIWRADTGDVLQTLEPPDATAVTAVGFDPDGERVATGGEDGAVYVWDVDSGSTLAGPITETGEPVRSIAFAPDGDRLAVRDRQGTVILWDPEQGDPLGDAIPGDPFASRLSFSPDGATLVLGSRDGINVWSTEDGTLLDTVATPERVEDAVFSPDGAVVAAVSTPFAVSEITLWDVTSGEQVGGPVVGHQRLVRGAEFSPDGDILASWDERGIVRLWDTQQPPSLGRDVAEAGSNAVAFSPDAELLASGSSDGYVAIHSLPPEGAPVALFPGHDGEVTAVTFSPDGELLASSGEDGLIRLWDATTGAPEGQPLAGHGDQEGPDAGVNVDDDPLSGNSPRVVNDVAFSPDGELLASAGNDGAVVVWNTSDGTQDAILTRDGFEAAFSVEFSPDGATLASTGGIEQALGAEVRLWDVATGELTQTLTGHTNTALDVAFSPDGTRVAAGGGDGTLRVWDVTTGQSALNPIQAHDSTAYAIAFSAVGTTLLSGGPDETLRIWDADSGAEVARLSNQGFVRAIAVSTDGNQMAVTGWGGTTVWPTLWELADACEVATRYVTREQIESFLPEGVETGCTYSPGIPQIASVAQPEDSGSSTGGDGLDQVNEPPVWGGGATNIVPGNDVGQSFTPTLPVLTGVEVDLVRGNRGSGDGTLTLTITGPDGTTLARVDEDIPEGFDGPLRFDLPAVDVTPGHTLTMTLADTGNVPVFWKYSGRSPYPAGQAFFGGSTFRDNDFLFKTYGTGGE